MKLTLTAGGATCDCGAMIEWTRTRDGLADELTAFGTCANGHARNLTIWRAMPDIPLAVGIDAQMDNETGGTRMKSRAHYRARQAEMLNRRDRAARLFERARDQGDREAAAEFASQRDLAHTQAAVAALNAEMATT